MTLYRATVLDTPADPFTGGTLRAESDAAVVVRHGVIVARGPYAETAAAHPDDDVVHLESGVLLPGFVDTHVHFPQVRVIGSLGMPLLDWLEHVALPEEARLADAAYAAGVADDFLDGLVEAGTTSALVFGAHFADAVDTLFSRADRRGLRITSGLVTSDRILRDELLTTPERAYDESLALARRWHGTGRLRYAVTPRFSLSCSSALLDACGSVVKDAPGVWCTSHVNENDAEIAQIANLFDGTSYVEMYEQHGLLDRRTVLAHNVHPTDAELDVLAARGASVAHCPTSNAALASGLFPMRRHVERGVRVALGTDVGAGTGLSLLKEGLQAYFAQQLLGPAGLRLTAAHLLHLATSAGAVALGLVDQVGDLSVGKQFDAVWVRPPAGSTLDVGLRHAASDDDALATVFALGTPADLAGVWVAGDRVKGG
ncbi:guanine deaminase [Luteipulveratus halotolerans]|uniref:Guanine deaminase n=1 Tax=Luteipulveratus halotolerans TaxID=1631356 RepID=A0A0L6CEC8_9MICO|nr:guanine deaminase [Luteipulveratus halotolerans]KNX36024.1 guanine deaminase [Luteipulveratus halotolerans]